MQSSLTMFGMVVAAGMVAGTVKAASVAAVTITPYERTVFDGAVAALPTAFAEDFESFSTGETIGGLNTAVGVFDTLGPRGSGGTVKGTRGNTGTGLFMRDRAVYGRSNTTSSGKTYLDSNDTFGLSWTITGLGMFDNVFFTMSDVADSGATFTLLADGEQVGPAVTRQRNKAISMVMLSFETAIDSLTLELRHNRLNDGFSIDDAGIGLSLIAAPPPSAVPLPPAAVLLAGGVAALACVRRRRT